MTLTGATTGAPAPGDETLGGALRAAREAAGLSIEQVSSATRIRAALVRDLEADRLASSGGAVYARGHVRALAHAIGVDACPLVARLDRAVGEPTTALGPVPVSTVPERRGPRWAPAAAVAAAVLAVMFGVGTWLSDRPSLSDSAQLLTAPEGLQPLEPAPDAGAQLPDAAPPAAAPAGAVLAVRVAGAASWISVSSPSQLLFEGEVGDGWTETFRGESELRLRVGNAAAVHVACAGVDAGPAGGKGEVRTLVCGAGGLSPV